MISYSNAGTPNYALGTVATYSCDSGFVLDLSVGSEMRTCIDDGDNDAEGIFDMQEPACVRKSAIIDPKCKIQKHFQNVMLVGMASEISKNFTYKCVDRSRHNGIKGAKAKCAH